eukprot:354200-Pleurochrysis_carterae.AAC.1
MAWPLVLTTSIFEPISSVALSGVSEIAQPASSGADDLSQVVASQPPPHPAAPAAKAMVNPEILEQRPEQQEPATWGLYSISFNAVY